MLLGDGLLCPSIPSQRRVKFFASNERFFSNCMRYSWVLAILSQLEEPFLVELVFCFSTNEQRRIGGLVRHKKQLLSRGFIVDVFVVFDLVRSGIILLHRSRRRFRPRPERIYGRPRGILPCRPFVGVEIADEPIQHPSCVTAQSK